MLRSLQGTGGQLHEGLTSSNVCSPDTENEIYARHNFLQISGPHSSLVYFLHVTDEDTETRTARSPGKLWTHTLAPHNEKGRDLKPYLSFSVAQPCRRHLQAKAKP